MAQSDPLTARQPATAKEKYFGLKKVLTGLVTILDIHTARFEGLKRALVLVAVAYRPFVFWLAIAAGPLLVFRFVSEYIVTDLPPLLQILAFVVWGALLAYPLLLIATESRRESLFATLQEFGSLTPVIYSINVLIVAVIFFSSVTHVLVDHGVLTLTSRTGRPAELAGLLDFYMWHFLEAVPLLKVTQTLRWDEPWTYDSAAVGWIILLFKLVVIVPVIGAFLGYWNRRTAPPRT